MTSSAALVTAYRELVDKLYLELGSYGVPVPSAVGERVRDGLVGRYPALKRFVGGAKPEDPPDDQEEITAAVEAKLGARAHGCSSVIANGTTMMLATSSVPVAATRKSVFTSRRARMLFVE